MTDIVTDEMIRVWRINYGLSTRAPAEAMRWWADGMYGHAPAGAVAALGVCLEEIERQRAVIERMRSALRVIHIWADFDIKCGSRRPALDPKQTRDLCAKALENER